MFWIILIIVIFIIIYKVIRSHNEEVHNNVTSYGGMKQRYNKLISYFIASGMHITKTTKDSIELQSETGMYSVYIFYCGKLEITIQGFFPMVGDIKHHWSFNEGCSQEEMIQQFESYCESVLNKSKDIADNNPYKYFNNND